MTGYTYMQRVYAIKRFRLRLELNYENPKLLNEYNLKLYDVLREVCILKLCGVLGIGPYPYNPMCFDVVTYSNAIDIAM